MSEHGRPKRYGAEWFDRFPSDEDPLERVRLASETAAALLSRVRSGADPEVVQRLLDLAAHDGIDTVTELWSHASAHSLPGALWRIHVIQALVVQRADETASLYSVGALRLHTIDPIVAGAAVPTGPEEIRELADEIMRGAFTGDFALALERASAFCRVVAAGAVAAADDHDAVSPDRAHELTARGARLARIADDLAACAPLWRSDDLH